MNTIHESIRLKKNLKSNQKIPPAKEKLNAIEKLLISTY